MDENHTFYENGAEENTLDPRVLATSYLMCRIGNTDFFYLSEISKAFVVLTTKQLFQEKYWIGQTPNNRLY